MDEMNMMNETVVEEATDLVVPQPEDICEVPEISNVTSVHGGIGKKLAKTVIGAFAAYGVVKFAFGPGKKGLIWLGEKIIRRGKTDDASCNQEFVDVETVDAPAEESK